MDASAPRSIRRTSSRCAERRRGRRVEQVQQGGEGGAGAKAGGGRDEAVREDEEGAVGNAFTEDEGEGKTGTGGGGG